MSDNEPTIDQILKGLDRLREMAGKLPPEFQSAQEQLAELCDQFRRAREWMQPYPPEKIEGN
jgi:hypothetical protein